MGWGARWAMIMVRPMITRIRTGTTTGIPTGIVTGTRMMDDPADLLRLVQWLSPAFPTGAYAYSHGLEQAVSMGDVVDAAGFSDWLSDILAHGAGWNDAVLMACALRGEDGAHLADVARALAPSAERLRETEDQGAAFAKAVSEMGGGAILPAPLPVAVGVAGRGLNVKIEQKLAVFLHSFASNLVSAGVRFIPLGQAAGQRVLAAQHGLIVDIAARAAQAGLGDLGGAAIRADLQSMQHEELDVRIFKT